MIDGASIRVGVILVNWCGWRDTLTALETLFAGDHVPFDVVVVDNDSGDDSLEHIVAWAEGREQAEIPLALTGRVCARADKVPITYVLLDEGDIDSLVTQLPRLTVIRASKNLGFAGGNNLGLRYFSRRGGYDYFWLLNNDAFPAADALSQLVARAGTEPSLGMVGSTLVFARRPDVVQALGGAEFDYSTARAYHIGADSPLSALPDIDAAGVEARMSYPIGASILISASFLAQVGPMEDSYFLYFEEIDWAERCKPAFSLGYARDSLVYHRAGGSTQKASRRSALASYYLARNRLAFTRRFHPEHVASVRRGIAADAVRYLVRARWGEAKGFIRALRESAHKRNSEMRP